MRTLKNTIIRYHDEVDGTDGVLVLSEDVTEKFGLSKAQKELSDYISALDAHAIVAATDSKGVIVYANDKFCAISQYSREELYGRTHRLINSGCHNKAFFENLWSTISGGSIWQGEICNRARDGSNYWVFSTIVPFLDETGLPEKYISIRADVTPLKEAERRANVLALYDPLTSLPNRRLFFDRLTEAKEKSKRTGQYFAVVSIDMDDFKKINDVYGHSQGDSFLCEVGNRLTKCIRNGDIAARIGGDEFFLILEDTGVEQSNAMNTVSAICGRALQTLRQPYEAELKDESLKRSFTSTASMGVIVSCGDLLKNEEILQQVDVALYTAKGSGKNSTVFFDAMLKERLNFRLAMENDLHLAISRQELQLYYQPIVDSAGNTTGMEALLRWIHPVRGFVPPDEFIPIAEQSGQILPIGQWVIETACQQLIRWATDSATSNWKLSINVSAKQLGDIQFQDHFHDVLRKTGANPSRLCIELTETALLSRLDDELMRKIDALRAMGVHFALDDFGVGYSSLTYLKRLPLDRVKIDKSFVNSVLSNPIDKGIVAAVIVMAESRGLEIVAEGVETQDQFNYLSSVGCNFFQGYLFGRPSPVNQ